MSPREQASDQTALPEEALLERELTGAKQRPGGVSRGRLLL